MTDNWTFADDNAAVSHQYMSGLSRTSVVLPWETPLMKQIFGDDGPSLSLSMPLNWGSIPQPFASQSPEIDVPEIPSASRWTCAKYVKHVSDETYMQQRDRTMKGALSKWRFIVMLDLEKSDVGRQLKDADTDTVDNVLVSVMGVKSPNTVLKRANATMMYYRWHAVHGKNDFLPFHEDDVWRYVMFQTTAISSASRSQSLLQALRFCHYVMGFDKALECASSRRIAGQAQIQLSARAPARQARPLTVNEVKALHAIADGTEYSATDRCVASNLLLALYGRCRVSDVNFIHEILHDLSGGTGFIEVSTRCHKGARSAQQKAMLLPIVISSEGVTDPPWVQTWIRNRKECMLPTAGLVQGALMPSPAFGDKVGWLSRPLSTSEVTAILKGFLKTDDPCLTSHSLKATTLSWSAKAEMPREQRRILGRHAATVQGSDSFYSRDMSVGPVNSLQKIIKMIKEGSFTPDATRSNYFPMDATNRPGTPAHVVMQPFTPAFLMRGQPGTPNLAPAGGGSAMPVVDGVATAAAADAMEVKTENSWSILGAGAHQDVIELSSDSSAESSESCTCSESSDEDIALSGSEEDSHELDRQHDAHQVQTSVMTKNMKSKIVHECRDKVTSVPCNDDVFHAVFDDALTVCGRAITKQFSVIHVVHDWTSKCRVCFRGKRGP